MPPSDRDLKQPGLQEGVSNMFNAIKRSQEKVDTHRFWLHMIKFIIVESRGFLSGVTKHMVFEGNFWLSLLSQILQLQVLKGASLQCDSSKLILTRTVYDRAPKSESLNGRLPVWWSISFLRASKFANWEGFSPVWPSLWFFNALFVRNCCQRCCKPSVMKHLIFETRLIKI